MYLHPQYFISENVSDCDSCDTCHGSSGIVILYRETILFTVLMPMEPRRVSMQSPSVVLSTMKYRKCKQAFTNVTTQKKRMKKTLKTWRFVLIMAQHRSFQNGSFFWIHINLKFSFFLTKFLELSFDIS